MTLLPGLRYHIRYRDSGGAETVRDIRVFGFTNLPSGGTLIRAWCFLREEERYFRPDRILSVSAPLTDPSRSPWGGTPAVPLTPIPRPTPLAPTSWSPTSSYPPPGLVLGQRAPAPQARPLPARPAPSAYSEDPSTILDPFNPWLNPNMGVFYAICAAFALFMAIQLIPWGNPSSYASPSAHSSSALSTTSGSRPDARAPAAKPAPKAYDFQVAGVLIQAIPSGDLWTYHIPSLGHAFLNKKAAVAYIREPRFIARTAVRDRGVLDLYLSADSDGSGKLSFPELQSFQTAIGRRFSYKENELALRPDEFLAQGGGDCEDWALFTAGLLRYWGWEPYIGSLASGPRAVGHAVCLSYEEGWIPPGSTTFRIRGMQTWGGTAIPDGTYLPIDYEHVGALSNAVGTGDTLRMVYSPEECYGVGM